MDTSGETTLLQPQNATPTKCQKNSGNHMGFDDFCVTKTCPESEPIWKFSAIIMTHVSRKVSDDLNVDNGTVRGGETNLDSTLSFLGHILMRNPLIIWSKIPGFGRLGRWGWGRWRRQVGKVGKVGKVGRVGKAGKVGKAWKVGKVGKCWECEWDQN